MFSGWLTILEAMLCLVLRMAGQSFCGKKFGIISPPNSLFLAFSLLPGKKDSSVQVFLDSMNLEHNFHTPLFLYPLRLLRNIKPFMRLSVTSRILELVKTNGPTRGATPLSAHPSSIILLSSQFSPLQPLIGYGSPRSVRNSRSLCAWSSEIELTQRTSSEERVSWHLTVTLTALCVTCTVRRRLIIYCFAVLSVRDAGIMWVSNGIMILISSR